MKVTVIVVSTIDAVNADASVAPAVSQSVVPKEAIIYSCVATKSPLFTRPLAVATNSVPMLLSAAPKAIKSVLPTVAMVYVGPIRKLPTFAVVKPAYAKDFSVHTPEGSDTTYVGGLAFPNA